MKRQSSEFKARTKRVRSTKKRAFSSGGKLSSVGVGTALRKKFISFKLHSLLKSRLTLLLALLFGVFILLVAAYVFLFSNNFAVQTVILYEGDSVSTNKEYQNLVSQFRGRPLFSTSAPDITELFLLNGIQLADVTIRKEYPSSLIVYLQPLPILFKTNFFSAQLNPVSENTFGINSAGVLASEQLIPEATIPLEFIALDQNELAQVGDQVMDAELAALIDSTIQEYESQLAMKIQKARYLETARELHLLTERDFWVWLDVSYSTTQQIAKLKDAAATLQLYEKFYDYVDLRIPGQLNDRIYYKERQ